MINDDAQTNLMQEVPPHLTQSFSVCVLWVKYFLKRALHFAFSNHLHCTKSAVCSHCPQLCITLPVEVFQKCQCHTLTTGQCLTVMSSAAVSMKPAACVFQHACAYTMCVYMNESLQFSVAFKVSMYVGMCGSYEFCMFNRVIKAHRVTP